MAIYNWLKRAYTFILLVAIVMAIFLIILEVLNLNKICFGVKMANIDIGGKKTDEALTIINKNLKDFELSFQGGGETLTGVKPESLGIIILPDESVKKAERVGKKQNIVLGLGEQIAALFIKKNLPLSYLSDEEKFVDFVSANFGKFETPPKNATLVFSKKSGTFNVVLQEEGLLLQKEKLKQDLDKKISFLESGPIFLELQKAKPQVNEEGTLKAKEEAERLIANSPYFLVYKNEKRKIETDSLLDWITFVPKGTNEKTILRTELAENKIEDFLTQLAPALNFPPQNAKLAIENGRVIVFSLSQPGRELKIGESAQKIAFGILDEGKKEIELKFEETQPEITTSSIENLGLTTLLGKGTSNFAGSPQNRIYNIKLGLTKIQGVIVKAGEEFSLAKTVGDVDEKNGFLPELVIQKDKTAPEAGGGLCQVSTTVFRAAINSGLEITERYPHAFPVQYYSPQGFDATVYPPHPDLKFKNDTPSNILIQGKITGTILTIEIYGTNDGRKVIVSPPEEYDKKADGSMKTKFNREIWKDGELLKKETFYSSYKSPKLYPVEKKEETTQ